MLDGTCEGMQMARRILWATLVAVAALPNPAPAFAQDTDTLSARAAQSYNDALDAGKDGKYATACRGFNNAAALFSNAMNSLYSHSMATDEDRDYVKQYANVLQDRMDSAKQAANAACGLDDGPPPSSGGSTSLNNADNDVGTAEDLQQTVTLAKQQYQEADRLYDAHDFAGACTSARLSAASFGKVANALRSNRGLESAFANPDQIYANAAQAAADRDRYFCKA